MDPDRNAAKQHSLRLADGSNKVRPHVNKACQLAHDLTMFDDGELPKLESGGSTSPVDK
jgi:hypothetical protein